MEELEVPTKSEMAATNNNHHLDENDDDDDPPMLSCQALAALREFFTEQSHSVAESTTVTLISEDWRLSQFWYDQHTAETIAHEVLTLCQMGSWESPRVTCISCPTLYAYLRNVDPNVRVQLLEYDKRFEQYGDDFTFYDYNQPEELPSELKHAFHVVVADPPYLSKECLEKVSQTVSFLAQPGISHLLLLTGEVQKDKAAELMGLHPCLFRPQHSNKLGNEFQLFTNYDPGMRLGGWEQRK